MSPQRLNALADGVFAIAMTLLALELSVPVIGLNMLALFLMGWAMWTYATTRGDLTGDRVDPDLAHGARVMGLVYFVTLLASLPLAFVAPLASMVVYAVIVVACIVFTVAGRWEAVTVWRQNNAR